MRLRASPSGPLRGTAAIPGDKSTSHRALILGALAAGQTRIRDLLEAGDVLKTVDALRAFGVSVERAEDGCWRVSGRPWRSPSQPIDCGNSGTTARLLIGAAAGQAVRATFTGDQSLQRRPMRRVTEPLTRMGARFDGGDRLPLTLQGGALSGFGHLNSPPSAQVKSAILLAGLATQDGVEVTEPVSSRDHTEILLAQFGCDLTVADGDDGRTVSLGKRRSPRACDIVIAADPSSASFLWLAAAVIPGSEVYTPGVLVNPRRTGFVETLGQMGAGVRIANERLQSGELVADVTVAHRELRPLDLDSSRIPAMIDELPALAIAAAFAKGETIIHGVGELRVKESDRLEAIVAGLASCGAEALADGDALRILGRGAVRGGGAIATKGDHRIAMAFAVLGLAAREPVVVDAAEMIATSFPNFAGVMRSVGAVVDELE